MKSEIWNSEIWNLTYSLWNPKSKFWNLKFQIWNLKSKIWILQSEIWNMVSEIWNPQSEIRNLKSKIWNLKSKTWDHGATVQLDVLCSWSFDLGCAALDQELRIWSLAFEIGLLGLASRAKTGSGSLGFSVLALSPGILSSRPGILI